MLISIYMICLADRNRTLRDGSRTNIDVWAAIPSAMVGTRFISGFVRREDVGVELGLCR